MRVTLIALLLLTAACGEPAATPPAASSSSEPTAGSTPSGVVAVLTGAPVVANDARSRDTVEWCPYPAGSGDCPGIDVTGLPAGTVEAFDDPEQMWQVEGVYDGRRLVATGAPEVTDWAHAVEFPMPCEGLRGAHGQWGDTHPGALTAVTRYLATVPDRQAGEWWSRGMTVLTVQLTGDDIAEHKAALQDVVGDRGTVCVVGGARYSIAELQRAQRRATDIALDAKLGLWSSSIDVVDNRVDLEVDYSDEPTRRRIRQEAGDAVRIRAFLALRDATLAQLPEAPRRGNVELETANQRGGVGMGAAGRFTVRFDAEQRCVYGEFGSQRIGLIWPFGYYATSDPLQVFNQDGQLVARDGDVLDSGGGHVPRKGSRMCGASEVWVISNHPTKAGSSEGTPR